MSLAKMTKLSKSSHAILNTGATLTKSKPNLGSEHFLAAIWGQSIFLNAAKYGDLLI
jgi:hypothetical protein